jgi:hypothetical protein
VRHTALTGKFFGGQAHNGIADQAKMLWNAVGEIAQQVLAGNPRFELTVTGGHSLGAGAACLLTIKCYHEKLVVSTTRSDALRMRLRLSLRP